jgi:hypothetical protein
MSVELGANRIDGIRNVAVESGDSGYLSSELPFAALRGCRGCPYAER